MFKNLWRLLPILLFIPAVLLAQSDKVISYGGDLTPEEQVVVFRDFPLPQNVKASEIKSLKVSNEEEWSLLKGLVPDEQIGTKAVSSIYVERLNIGEGIKVQTKNLTYITPHMLANAMVTSGVSDVSIFATAPGPVSGTAALTGIYKCYEELTNRKLSAYAKRTAAQELIKTADLGEKIGKEQTALLVERAKERVISENVTTKQEVIKIIQQGAREQNIKISNEDQGILADLLLRIKSLNLNITKLQTQLKNFKAQKETQPEPAETSFLTRIIAFFQSLFKQLFSFAGRFFRIGN